MFLEKHSTREIGITVTEYWFIFDQRCLVWPFDRSFASDWQLPPLNDQPIGTLSLWNYLWLAKVSRHRLHFLKPENRAMRRCRSLVFSQNTWITICWKVIMKLLPNDAKNILPTAGLNTEKQNTTSKISFLASTLTVSVNRLKLDFEIPPPPPPPPHWNMTLLCCVVFCT